MQWRHLGVTLDLKLIFWLNLERTLDKRRGKMGVVTEKTTAKKRSLITFRGDD